MDPVEQHLEGLARDRYSLATIAMRRRTLSTLPDPLNVDRDRMAAWWEGRQQTAVGTLRAASSLAQEKSHLRTFYLWAITKGLIDHNPADWLSKIRQGSTLATPVREPDLARALLGEGPMHRATALAAMAGLRSAEIATVDWSDIDRDAGILWVRRAKGVKDRSVPLSAGLLAELGDPGGGRIVTGPNGRALSAKAVSTALGRHLRASGVDASAHKLRARYATRFLAATGDLAATAREMGHVSVATTQKYLIASSDTMRKGAEAAGRVG